MIKKLSNERIMSTSQVNKYLGFTVTADFLKDCGLSPMLDSGRAGVFWRMSDFPLICRAISKKLDTRANIASASDKQLFGSY